MDPVVPAGWRRLKIGEVTKEGDRYFITGRSGADLNNDWGICIATIGHTVASLDLYRDCFIRKEEKEWLNPWD